MRTASRLATLAVRVAPADRKSWAEGLEAELEHVPAGETTAFAAGGLLTAMRLRLGDPAFVLGAARWGLSAGGLIWAALHLRLALRLERLDAAPPAVTEYLMITAAIFGLGGLITAAGGLRFTSLLGLPMLAMAAIYTAAAGILMPHSPNRAFHHALALEDLLSLAAAVAIAAAARRYASRARRTT